MKFYTRTPHYFLRDGTIPVGPTVLQTSLTTRPHVIFGFSTVDHYTEYLDQSKEELTAHSLDSRFLQDEHHLRSHSMNLVVIDPRSPDQRLLLATTFVSVLKAYRENNETILASKMLLLEDSSQKYWIQDSSEIPRESAVN